MSARTTARGISNTWDASGATAARLVNVPPLNAPARAHPPPGAVVGYLVGDEPTSALDVTVQRRVLDQLDELTDRLGTAVMLITHDLALATERADRVAVMHRGRIVKQGSSREILGTPRDDYTRELLAAVSNLSSARTRPAPPAPPMPLVQVRGLRKDFELRGQRRIHRIGDAAQRKRAVGDLLDHLQRELRLTYLFISHDLSVARMISDEVHVMHGGRIVESGTPDELFAHPRDPYTAELLAAIPGRSRAS